MSQHWRSQRGLWRSNYETRVCECLWLVDYANVTCPSSAPKAVVLNVPKTRVEGTGDFVNYVSDEDILMTGPLPTAVAPAEEFSCLTLRCLQTTLVIATYTCRGRTTAPTRPTGCGSTS